MNLPIEPIVVDWALAWISRTALQLIVIVAATILAYRVIHHAVPPFVRLALVKPAAGDPAEAERRRETLTSVFLRSAATILAVIAAFMVLSAFDVNIAPAIAGVGVIGVAVGLGAQNLVRDCLSGLFILLENQFAKGDIVRLGPVSGVVEDFSLRRTVLRDQDGSVHFVPNSEIKIASNLSRDFSRVNVDLAIDPEADLDRAIGIIDQVGAALAADPEWAGRVIAPPHFVRVDRYAEAAWVIRVQGETRAGKQWEVTGEFLRRLRAELRPAGIRLAGTKTPEPPPAPPAVPPPPPPPRL